MFNSLFNKSKTEGSNNGSKKGLVKEEPILTYSIASSYVYLDSLCSIANGLSYERLGTVISSGFPNVIDKYVFSLNGKIFCEIFIYPYHNENQNIIPTPFKELNSNIDEDVFVLSSKGRFRYLIAIAELVLTKSKGIDAPNELWNTEKQLVLTNLLSELGYEDELERLINDNFIEIQRNIPEITKIDFIQQFAGDFHNKKLIPYTPDFVQERNRELLSAYDSIVETINRIQAWQDNELVRKRIEINTLNSNNDNSLGISAINNCITPFCFISLGCDNFGRFNLSYGIDSRILNMLSDNMGSTLLRRIYEFTPGELEPFVGFVSLSMDCITYFENSLKDVLNENYSLIVVKRHEEKSISDMLNKLELRDDVDKETKKWLKR